MLVERERSSLVASGAYDTGLIEEFSINSSWIGLDLYKLLHNNVYSL